METQEPSLISIIRFIKEGDAIAFLVAFLWGLYTRKIRWGKDYDADMERVSGERDTFRDLFNLYHNKLETKVEEYERRALGKSDE